ncbi:MAG: glycosyltransferase family 2 protein [Ignavibacteriaceae bacterium]
MLNNNETVQPEVSVVMAVFNRANYLSRSVGSLIIQTFKDWELIAVDDGSEDDTFKILKQYENANKNIKVIRQTHQKLALSRNRGIEASSGKHITFLDSDDEYVVDHLQKHVEFMKENPEIDLIHGGVKIIGDEYVRDKNDPHKLIHLSECTIGGSFFAKRNVFLDLKGFKNLKYSEDSEFLERAERIFRIQKVNFKTYKYYRDLPDSITNSYEPE